MPQPIVERAHWESKLGFILAATGSAVGLGNIWRFPYQTGEHGGGLFVLTYLACVALIGLPVFMAEVFMGRTTQRSPVGAFRAMTRPASPWLGVGWIGVIAAFVILSFYSVIAGWAMHYTWISLTDSFVGKSPEEIEATFGALATNPALSSMWHIVFMALTVGIVVAGIREGIEVWVKILMPAFLGLLLILLGYAMVAGDFAGGMRFIFRPDFDHFTAQGVLAAMGQALFSLSVGMGALIAYGSYLRKEDDLVGTSITVGIADAGIAILAAMVIFPILLGAGRDPEGGGPGLVFQTLPIAFSQMPGGLLLAPAFFILLVFAALTSSISLLEVATSYFIDERGWTRGKAALATGGLITILGIPSAIAGRSAIFGSGMEEVVGMAWLDLLDYLTGTWLLPIGAFFIAVFVAWRVGDAAREQAFKTGTRFGQLYWGWVSLLRYVVPLAVLAAFLNLLGVFDRFAREDEEAPDPPAGLLEEATTDGPNAGEIEH